jgi:hypothetical protein
VPTRFAPEIQFEVRAAPAVPFRATLENRFEALRQQLLVAGQESALEAGPNAQLRQAANEAEALAWVTPYPLLVFPVLFEEKAQEARLRALRQKHIRRRSREMTNV